MVNENEHGLACIMCATPRPRPRSRTTVVVVDTAVAASSMMMRAESSNDGADISRGDRGAVSFPQAHSRTRPITAATTATASSMARVESNDSNDGNASATTTALKRECPLVTKKRPSRVAKKTVSYSEPSDSEVVFDEDGDEAPKKRSFKKKENDTNDFELLGQVSVSRSPYSYPLDTEDSYDEGEDEGHGGIKTDLNYVRDEESDSYHDDSDSDSDGDELNDDSSAFDGDDPYHESFGQDIVDGLADEDDTDEPDEHHVPWDFDNSAERGMFLLTNTMKQMEKQGKGPVSDEEKAHQVKMIEDFSKLFHLGYPLVLPKCKPDEQGRLMYDQRPIDGPVARSPGVYFVKVAGGPNDRRKKTG